MAGLRILHVADSPRHGGAERVLLQHVRAQMLAGHHAVVLTPQPWLAEEVRRQAPGARADVVAREGFRRKTGMARRAAALAALAPLRQAVRAHRPDVVHANNGGYPGSEICRAAPLVARAAWPRATRIMTVHAVPRSRTGEPPGAALIDAAVWRCTDAVIGATRAVQRALVGGRGMPPSLFELIPYGVDAPAAADGAPFRARLGLGEEDMLAVMVSATDDEQKGHHVLVEAVARTPGVHAAFVGAAPATANGAERVHTLGRVEDIAAAYAAADIVCVPSVRDESLPLVVLEAMAAGRPVVASRLAGIPEAVDDPATGWLVEPGDAADLARALAAAAAATDERARRGETGRARWLERFSVAAMTSATMALYAAAE